MLSMQAFLIPYITDYVVLRGLRIVDGPWLLRAAARHRAYRVLAR